MNRKFIFSMSVAMSFILGLGFVIVSQTALAVQFTYPYSSSNYNKAYSPNNNTSSSYDSASYNKAYSPNNNTSSSYDSASYNKAYSPNNNTSSSYDSASYNKAYSPYNIDKNDKYPNSYIKSTEFSKYPTLDKIYECQTGPLEGFFTSSVEFCIAATENVR
jgi:cytoskeletal protein RodZ